LSRLFEPPTSFELEDNVAGGSATLSPMRGTVIEIGSRGERDLTAASSLSWDVSLYHAAIDDEILSVDDPAAPGTSLATNVDETVHAGVEAFASGSFALRGGRGVLEPLVSVTLNDFRFDGHAVYGDNDLPAAPEFLLRGEVMYRGASGFFVGPTFDRVGARWADFANTYRIPSHTLVGLRGGWSGGKWQAFAELRNVTDERYVVSHSVRNVAGPGDAILNPGEPRSAYFGVSFALP
jgi:iron complex outermembrane receptor protein